MKKNVRTNQRRYISWVESMLGGFFENGVEYFATRGEVKVVE